MSAEHAKTWPQIKAEWQADRDRNPAYWFWGRDRILTIDPVMAVAFLGMVQGCEARIEKAILCGREREMLGENPVG